jgi:ABC-2 type transport system permease protein
LGKYLSALFIFILFLGLTIPYIAFLAFKSEVLWKILLLQNVGMFLLAASILSISMVLSSLTENQVIAGMLAVGVNLTLFLIGRISAEMTGPLHLILDELMMTGHLSSFIKGVFDLKDLFYFLLWPVFSIYLVQRVLESRRWLSS